MFPPLVLFIFIGEHLIYIYTAQAERFQLEDDRVLFMFRDGSAAWEAKDFLIEQEWASLILLFTM